MQSAGVVDASRTHSFSGTIIRSGSWPGLRCHDVTYEPFLRLTPHSHELPFFGLSLCGGYEETTAGSAVECGQGTAVYHGSREEHAVRVGRDAVRCFIVEVDGEMVEQRFACGLPSSRTQPGAEASAILAAMYREFRVADAAAELSLQGLLLQLIATVSRSEEGLHGRPPFLRRLEDFLRANFRSQLTLDEIADAVGAPGDKVSAAFRAFHGRSIADEQRRLRIEHACRRMVDASLPLATIAAECGFADQSHFSRAFHRVKGTTPARYRTTMR